MSKKLLSLILAALLLAGCEAAPVTLIPDPSSDSSEPERQEAPVLSDTLRVAAITGDSFNPFTCKTLQNSCLSTLLYEPLAALSPSYEAELRLAEDITVTDLVCAVTLRSGLAFSDGSPLTAQDVAYTLEAARNIERYRAQLSGIASVQATGEHSLIITLSAPDVYFDRCLTVPIVKYGTMQSAMPPGVGRYLYDEESRGFIRNPDYWGEPSAIERVELLWVTSDEEQAFAVVSGGLDMLYSDLRGDIDLGSSTGHRMVTLNNLVFIGVNRAKWQFSAEFMRLLGSITPRADIVGRSYLGYATAAAGIINPAFEGLELPESRAAAAEIEQALRNSGFGEPQEDGWRLRYGQPFALSLLVSTGSEKRVSAAHRTAEAFAAYGIRIEVTELGYQEYLTQIADGSFDLYLGEMRLTDNMDVSALVTPGGGLSSGIVEDAELLAAYQRFREGIITATEFCELYSDCPTVIPVAFRRGIISYSRSFSANIVATQQDIFYNIKDWQPPVTSQSKEETE